MALSPSSLACGPGNRPPSDGARKAAAEIFELFRDASYFATRNEEHRRQMLDGWAEIIDRNVAAPRTFSEHPMGALPWKGARVDVQCFMAERTDLFRESLRRYAARSDAPSCPGAMGYHNAEAVIGAAVEDAAILAEHEGAGLDDLAHDDPRWPRACACGYEFREGDPWQHNRHRLYKHPLVLMTCGKPPAEWLFVLGEAPVGAMWEAPWMSKHWIGPDGKCLVVRTPGGDWTIDAPSRNADGTQGGRWTRTGIPPNITVRPSILAGSYHGWLTDGVLRAA